MAKPHHKPANVKLTGNSALRKPQRLGGKYVPVGPKKDWSKDEGLKAASKVAAKPSNVVPLPKGKAPTKATPAAAPAAELSPAKKAWETIRAKHAAAVEAAKKAGQPAPLTPAQKAWITIRAKRAEALKATIAKAPAPVKPVAVKATAKAKAPAPKAPKAKAKKAA